MPESEFDAEQARRDLYEVMSRDEGFESKAHDALQLGRKYLDVGNAHLTKIDAETDYRKVIASSDPPDGVITPGLVTDLQHTFCRETIERDSPLSIHDAESEGYGDHPAAQYYGIQCYHGTTITIDGEIFGTVCFGSLEPREDPFSEDETLYAELIGRMLEHEINRERIEAEIERLERFASVVSHDLRNPLNVAKSRLELEQTERESENVEAATTALDRMEGIISDVLTVARQGREVDETELVSLESLIESCEQTVDLTDATVTVEDDLKFQADRNRVKQILENLLRNCLDHGRADGPGGEPVAVTVGSLAGGNGFYVADDGPGIPEAEREDVFESGYSTAEEGTGLGLAIVVSVADAHGWDVDVTESDAGGARFEISDVVSPP